MCRFLSFGDDMLTIKVKKMLHTQHSKHHCTYIKRPFCQVQFIPKSNLRYFTWSS